jgi:hypothetical protein
MTIEVKIGNDTFVFDDWKLEEKYPGAPKPGIKWFRPLITKNGEKYAPSADDISYSAGFIPANAVPHIEIVSAIDDTLYFMFKFFLYEDYALFSSLKDSVYPFPKQYTKNNDYGLAKKHCDRFLTIINNLLIFT